MQNTYEVVYNDCFGGFGFSNSFIEFAKSKDLKLDSYIERDNPKLISLLKEFGLDNASASFAELRIGLVPSKYDFGISEYDGMETIVLKATEEGLEHAYNEGLEAVLVYCEPFMKEKLWR